jgi:hypothetical protein
MEYSINKLQKYLFILLLYQASFSPFVWDLLKSTNRTALYLVSDGLIGLIALLSLSYLRGKLLAATLFIFAGFAINLTYAEATFSSFLNGIREIVMVIGIVLFFAKVFAPGNEALREEYLEVMKTFAFVFLFANLPIAFYQYMINGPTDAVGGSFGYGASGALTFTIVILVYFMQLHYSHRFFLSILLFLTLIPLLLNETKVSFILIPAMVFILKFKPRIGPILLAAGGAVLFFIIFNRFFEATFLDFDDSASGIFSQDFLSDYLAADSSKYVDIPRITKITLAWDLLMDHTNTLFFGIEYGVFRGGNTVEQTHFTIAYQWLLFGTRPYLFFLMVQGGLFLISGMFYLVFYANQFFRNSNKFQWFLFSLFLLIMLYNDLFRIHTFVIVYFFLVFFAASSSYRRQVGDEEEPVENEEESELAEPVNYR